MEKEFRKIPFYENYGVSKDGEVISFKRNLLLKPFILNGYLVVNTFGKSLTETLPIHRAIALAWLENSDPENFTIINHKDGNKLNNEIENLEWSDHSLNNLHAINNGLRSDNVPCKIRNFYTGEIIDFPSISQAAEYLGFRKDTSMNQFRFKKFGRLINEQYEFRLSGDSEPWFYEGRKSKIRPTRFWVTVIETNGLKKEFFKNSELLKEYQLYQSVNRSMPGLVDFLKKLHPEIKIEIRDGFSEPLFRVQRNVKKIIVRPVKAFKDGEELYFSSLTKCAKFFNVDRFSIATRIVNCKDLNGWSFTYMSS